MKFGMNFVSSNLVILSFNFLPRQQHGRRTDL